MPSSRELEQYHPWSAYIGSDMVGRKYDRILPFEGPLDVKDKWGMMKSATLQKQGSEERYSTRWERRHQWLGRDNRQMD